MLKIAFISPFQFRMKRGIERYVWSLAEKLSLQGDAVSLFTWRELKPADWGPVPTRVQIRQVPNTRYFRERVAFLFYSAWLRAQHYDWVISFFGTYGEVPTLRFLPAQTRSCIVFHFPRQLVAHQYAAFDRHHVARRADQLIAVSQPVALGVNAYFERSCVVIGNGVDPNLFQTTPIRRLTMREKLNVLPTTPVLITLAALEERKGVQWMLQALPYLLSEFPDLQYWVLGEGPFRESLEADIQRLNLTQTVRLIGSTDDVVGYLSAADIGCLLSIGEAFPLTLLEYMSMSLPVLTSNHPPFDSLINSAWGIALDAQDAEAVSGQLRNWLHHPELRRQLGLAGRGQVLSYYSWEKVSEQYRQLLTVP